MIEGIRYFDRTDGGVASVRMTEFLLEIYASDVATAETDAERVRACARRMRDEGTPVHVLRAIFLPQDETSLLFFEAASPDVVRTTAEGAGLPVDRIAVAVPTPGEEPCE